MCNYQGQEITLIKNLRSLDDESRTAVETALSESAFIMDIEKIISIETEYEIRNWQVITRQGPHLSNETGRVATENEN